MKCKGTVWAYIREDRTTVKSTVVRSSWYSTVLE